MVIYDLLNKFLLGVILIFLIQPIMAFFRPGKDAPKRKLFNWMHRTVGLAALFLSIATLFLGSKFYFTDNNWLILLCIWIGWIFILPIILEITQYCLNGTNKFRTCEFFYIYRATVVFVKA